MPEPDDRNEPLSSRYRSPARTHTQRSSRAQAPPAEGWEHNDARERTADPAETLARIQAAAEDRKQEAVNHRLAGAGALGAIVICVILGFIYLPSYMNPPPPPIAMPPPAAHLPTAAGSPPDSDALSPPAAGTGTPIDGSSAAAPPQNDSALAPIAAPPPQVSPLPTVERQPVTATSTGSYHHASLPPRARLPRTDSRRYGRRPALSAVRRHYVFRSPRPYTRPRSTGSRPTHIPAAKRASRPGYNDAVNKALDSLPN